MGEIWVDLVFEICIAMDHGRTGWDGWGRNGGYLDSVAYCFLRFVVYYQVLALARQFVR